MSQEVSKWLVNWLCHCRLDTALFGVEHAISAQGGSWWDLLICHSSCRAMGLE